MLIKHLKLQNKKKTQKTNDMFFKRNQNLKNKATIY